MQILIDCAQCMVFLGIMCVYNEKCFVNYVEQVKDIKYEQESENFSHSGFRTDNESEMSTF